MDEAGERMRLGSGVVAARQRSELDGLRAGSRGSCVRLSRNRSLELPQVGAP